MAQRLKSNFLLALPSLIWSLVGSVILGVMLPLFVMEGIPNEPCYVLIFTGIFFLFMLVVMISFLFDFLCNWQWITISDAWIRVDCLLGMIKVIPLSQVKRCWVCKDVRFEIARGSWVNRDCLVIDTARTRKRHTIPHGFCRKKYRYIILPDTPEARYALRQLPEEVRTELT